MLTVKTGAVTTAEGLIAQPSIWIVVETDTSPYEETVKAFSALV